MAFAPIEQSCYWMAARPPRAATRLAGEVAADVAIVGAGFTGLWTALFLKELEPSLSVCVLEKSAAGYGASGRNAGIVGETIDHSHELAIAHFGLDEARELARIGRENLDEMEHFLRERGIDAGFERPGQLNVALTPAHVEGLEASRAAAERVGAAGWTVLSRAETQAEVASPLYLGALLAPRNALSTRSASSTGFAPRRCGGACGSTRTRRSAGSSSRRIASSSRRRRAGCVRGARSSRPTPTRTTCFRGSRSGSFRSTTTSW